MLWGRYAGTLGHPNKLGYFLVLTSLLSISLFLSNKNTRNVMYSSIIWFVLVIVQLYGIYLSGSITAYIGFLLGIVILALSTRSVLIILSRPFGMVIVAILASFFIFIADMILTDNGSAQSNNIIAQAIFRVQNSTAETRLTTYFHAWDRIMQDPIFGVGYDQISTSNISSQSRYLDYAVHNPLLQIWYTGGLFAFIGWLALYAWVGWIAVNVIRKKRTYSFSPLLVSLSSVALVILLMDQFQDAIYQREKWLVCGLFICAVLEHMNSLKLAKVEAK